MLASLLHRLRSHWGSQTLGLRLLGGYALLFTGSVVLLAALMYGLLVYFLQQPDRDFMEAQAQELAGLYREGGMPALDRALNRDDPDERRQELLIRLAPPRSSEALLLYNPDDWRPTEIDLLSGVAPPDTDRFVSLGTAEDGDPLAAYVLRLGPDRVLQVGMDADLRADVVESMQTVFLLTAFPVVFLAILGGGILAYRALRPLRRLVDTLHAVTETGDVEMRAPTGRAEGEFAEIVRLFNRMLDRIEHLVDGMRAAVDNVAHDLRTPMTRLRGRAETALQATDDPDARDALADAVEASDTVLEMLDAIMDVAEAEAGTLPLDLQRVDVSALVQGVADAYELVAEARGLEFTLDVPDGLVAEVDPSRMRRVVANLIDNAMKYTQSGGRVRVRTRPAPDDAPGSVAIIVEDTGIGIPPDEQPRIWDRLYRGDESRSERGLGLGLSLVRAIVDAHGGSVSVDSTPGEGARFTVVV